MLKYAVNVMVEEYILKQSEVLDLYNKYKLNALNVMELVKLLNLNVLYVKEKKF